MEERVLKGRKPATQLCYRGKLGSIDAEGGEYAWDRLDFKYTEPAVFQCPPKSIRTDV